MRAVCSGTDGIGCCGWSDMAKPPEITAPTPLSTLRLTHSPTVSSPFWESRYVREPACDEEHHRTSHHTSPSKWDNSGPASPPCRALPARIPAPKEVER